MDKWLFWAALFFEWMTNGVVILYESARSGPFKQVNCAWFTGLFYNWGSVLKLAEIEGKKCYRKCFDSAGTSLEWMPHSTLTSPKQSTVETLNPGSLHLRIVPLWLPKWVIFPMWASCRTWSRREISNAWCLPRTFAHIHSQWMVSARRQPVLEQVWHSVAWYFWNPQCKGFICICLPWQSTDARVNHTRWNIALKRTKHVLKCELLTGYNESHHDSGCKRKHESAWTREGIWEINRLDHCVYRTKSQRISNVTWYLQKQMAQTATNSTELDQTN